MADSDHLSIIIVVKTYFSIWTDPLVGTDKSSNSTVFVFLASKTFSWCKKSLLWSFGNNHLFLSYLYSKHYSVTNRDIWTTFCWLPDIYSGIWVGGLGSSYTENMVSCLETSRSACRVHLYQGVLVFLISKLTTLWFWLKQSFHFDAFGYLRSAPLPCNFKYIVEWNLGCDCFH